MWTNKFPEKEGWYFVYFETPQFGCEMNVGKLSFTNYLGWRMELVGSDQGVDAKRFNMWHPIVEPPMP